MKNPLICTVCNFRKNKLVYKSTIPISITSDLRVWNEGVKVFQCKHCGHVFKDSLLVKRESKKIYESYKLFEDNRSEDQAIFINNSPPLSRSQLLTRIIKDNLRLPLKGNFLDIGCNKGILINEFLKEYINWEFAGYDIDKSYSRHLFKLKNFTRFYSGDLNKIKEKFDLITLVHTLEHIPIPDRALKKIVKLLSDKGLLVIQVPNLGENPFDLLVFEHVSHFFPETLEQLLVSSGFEVILKSTQLIPKELLFVVKKIDRKYQGAINFSEKLKSKIGESVRFIDNYAKTIVKVKNKKSLIIFGTAEVGTWTTGLLNNQFSFFVDESPWRIGKKHLGKLIKHPRVLKKNSQVILAMAPIIASNVSLKWNRSKATFIYPNLL